MHKIMRQKTRIERSVKSASGQESFIIRLGISFVVVLGTAARNVRAKEKYGVDYMVEMVGKHTLLWYNLPNCR